MKHSLVLFFALVSLLPLGATAQWVWMDKDGHKVFSDRAPLGDIPDKSILKRPGQAAKPLNPESIRKSGAADSPEKTGAAAQPRASAEKAPGVDKELAERKKKAEQAQAAERKAEEDRVTKAQADNCSRARQAQKTLDSGARIGRINNQGEREVLDDAGRASEGKRIQSIIDSDCK